MKSIPFLLSAAFLAAFSTAVVSYAKIGETRAEIEGRLMSKNGGSAYIYTTQKKIDLGRLWNCLM